MSLSEQTAARLGWSKTSSKITVENDTNLIDWEAIFLTEPRPGR